MIPYFDIQGDDPRIYRIARIEKYIDRRGQIREAIAYGQLEKEIVVWYDLKRVKQTFSCWIVPTISKWENTRNWSQEAKNLSTTNRLSLKGGRGNSRGTERGRGRGSRGSGSTRGNYNQSYNQDYNTYPEDSGVGRGGPIGQSRRDQSYGSNYGSNIRRDGSRERWEDREVRPGRRER